MHYGMNVVIINSLDEVLCVNQHREVMCKTEEQLENTDEICFKIVDLTDPSNPGLIYKCLSIILLNHPLFFHIHQDH